MPPSRNENENKNESESLKEGIRTKMIQVKEKPADKMKKARTILAHLPVISHPFATTTIFDYDDTCFCYSALLNYGFNSYLSNDLLVHPVLKEALNQLSLSVLQLLITARSYGRVIIISNCEDGWILKSARLFMPHLVSFLQHHVELVHASSLYKARYPLTPAIWKARAFRDTLLSELNKAARKNIISIGDSSCERLALFSTMNNVSRAFAKSIKMMDKPNIAQLLKQIDMIRHVFAAIHNHENHLDLKIQFDFFHSTLVFPSSSSSSSSSTAYANSNSSSSLPILKLPLCFVPFEEKKAESTCVKNYSNYSHPSAKQVDDSPHLSKINISTSSSSSSSSSYS